VQATSPQNAVNHSFESLKSVVGAGSSTSESAGLFVTSRVRLLPPHHPTLAFMNIPSSLVTPTLVPETRYPERESGRQNGVVITWVEVSHCIW
jgi:hypothetical protein